MSLLNLARYAQPTLSLSAARRVNFLELVPSVCVQSERQASKKAGSSTRNRCKHTPGKKRGIHVYDGQRVPEGKLLVSQIRLQVLPGLNTRMNSVCSIQALTHGRVLLTTEKIDPNVNAFNTAYENSLPEHMAKENIYRKLSIR